MYEVTIPNSVTKIGASAFEGTPWYNNQPDGVVYIGKVAYKFKGEMASSIAINIKKGTVSISPSAFQYCSGLTSVTIPNSVTEIGESAFYGCTGLTSVTIPNSVTKIGESAFKRCTGLTSVTFGNSGNSGNSGTEIGSYAFFECQGLTSVTIGNSVTEIGYAAFEGCTGLYSITIPNSVTKIINSAFKRCAGLTSVTIGNSVTEIGYDAFNGCTALTSVTFNAANCKSPSDYDQAFFKECPLTSLVIGNDVKSIPDYLASMLTKLKMVTIGNSVTSIGDHAFEGCTGLTSVTINATNCKSPSYENSFFRSCPLTSLVIGNAVKSIPNYLAKGQTKLKTVTIPNSVTKIWGSAFSDCIGLTSITIPNSVTEIGGWAFMGCTDLKKIYSFNPEPPVIAEDTFSSYDACLFVPKGCVSKYKEAEYWKNFKSIKETYVENIDINGDGIIDMGDVTSLINMILDQ